MCRDMSWRRASLLAAGVNHFNSVFSLLFAAAAARHVGRRRKQDCRTHGMQQLSSNRLSTIHVGPKPLSRGARILVAAIILSIGIVSPWFICDSVLYEHAH